MDKNIFFDISAFFVFAILVFSTYYRGMTKGRINRYFFSVQLVGLLSVAFDIIAIFYDNLGPGNEMIKYISHTGYLLLHNYASPLYMVYLVALTDTWHIIRKSKITPLALSIPFALVVILLCTNPFTHSVFYLDANGAYTRGDFFIVLYANAFIYVLVGLCYLLYYRKLFPFKRFISLVVVFPAVILAVVFQFIFPTHPVELLANAISILFLCMMVQRPEEIFDSTTGLNNRHGYMADMRRSFTTGKKTEVIMINITNFNILNQMLGYDLAKELLHSIADSLVALNSELMLNSDLYYLGNGNFRIVLGEDSFSKAIDVASRVNNALKTNHTIHQIETNLVACVCIVNCPEDIKDIDSLSAFGDDLGLKHHNGEVLFASDIFKQQYYDIMRDIDRIIEDALSNHRFEVYYQPIFSVVEHRFNSAEALLRLKDEKYGFISPELFIPAAEKSGAIHKIGVYVLEEVCDFISSDTFKRLKIDYIEVNLSVAQCMQSSLAGEVLSILDKYEVSPSQINLEITETAASYSQNTLIENLNVLTDAGISFSLDDFGTGYSNMKRIASLPFRIVKLDKSFTDIEDNPKMMIVLENTINMIKDMSMKIVVEGIETEALVKQFSDLECEYIQGYYFSKPLPKQDFTEFILATL